MALGSQVSKVQAITDLTGLVHEVYAGRVKPNIDIESPASQLFQRMGRGQYRLDGEKLVFSTQLTYSGGAMGTDGKLPDHQYRDPVEGEATPGRFYVRRAIDNFIEQRAQMGPGSFGDLGGRLFDQMWEAFRRHQIRCAIGASDGVVNKCSSRTSSTVFVVKDGYGFAGTDPLMHLEPGMIIAWIDVSAGNAVGGAGKIASINYATNTVTMDSAATWEPSAQLAANDLIVFATTNNTTTDYFATEFNRQRNGIGTIVDPAAALTSVFNISQTANPRWKPFRQASASFDHIEVTEHFRKLRAKSTAPVTRQSHTCLASGAVIAELARTLVGFQQQQNLGRTFRGGYQAVEIAGKDFVEDDYFYHNVLVTLCHETCWNIDLGGEADYFAEDGSQFSRLADFDGKEWFVREYGNYVSDRRNRHGALTGIALPNVTAADFTPTPNY